MVPAPCPTGDGRSGHAPPRHARWGQAPRASWVSSSMRWRMAASSSAVQVGWWWSKWAVERERRYIGGGGGDGEFGWWRPAGGSGGVFDAGGGGDGVGAVGVYVVGPSSAVVVEVFVTAFGHGVGDVGAAAGLPRDDVVDVAALRRCVTPGDAASSVAGEHGAALGGGERADRPAVVQDPPVGGEKSFQGPAGGQTRHEAVGDGVPVEGGRGGTGAFERVAEQAAFDGAEVGAGVEEPVEVIGGDHPGAAQRGPVQHPDVSDHGEPFLAAVPVGVVEPFEVAATHLDQSISPPLRRGTPFVVAVGPPCGREGFLDVGGGVRVERPVHHEDVVEDP